MHIRRGPRKDIHHPGQSPASVAVLAPTASPVAPATAISAPVLDPTIPSAPAIVPTPSADVSNTPVAPTSADTQPQQVVRERAEPAEGELESEDDM